MQYLAYSSPATSCSEAHKADFLEPGVDSLLQVYAARDRRQMALSYSEPELTIFQSNFNRKSNRLEVHTLEATGLRLALTCSLFGTVLRSVPVKLRNVSTAALAVLTVDFTLFIVTFTPDGKTQTLASHSVNERGASRSEDFVTLLAGPAIKQQEEEYTKFLILHTFQGLVRVVLLDEDEKQPKRRASKAGKEDAIDLTRGFTTRIQELLLNAMSILPPSAGSASPRLATVHTDRQGQRVLQIHTLNLASKTLEPEDTDVATAFLLKSGTVLADPDSELLISLNNDQVAGLIVVGQDSARFVHTGRPAGQETVASENVASKGGPSIPEDGDEEMQSTTSKSAIMSPGKGKGKARELPSPTVAGGQPIPGVRRRSSASSQVGQLAISPPANSLGTSDPRSGNKRKLSESANSSGRGKSTAREKTSKVIECSLPICRYVAYVAVEGDASKFLLVDEWGSVILLKLTVGPSAVRRRTSSTSQSAAMSAALATSPTPSSAILATSPTSPTTPRARRASRSSFSAGSSDRLPNVKVSWEPVVNGKVSSPSSLVSLGGGYIFVGSHFGDSLLVRTSNSSADTVAENGMQVDTAEAVKASSGQMQLDILNTYTNLAPIVDFCVVETDDGKGPSHVVTCSGGKDDGTLRVVRHGVGLTELAALDMDGVQRVWSLSSTASALPHDLLVLSYLNTTRVLRFASQGEDTSIEEMDPCGTFDLHQSSLAACSFGPHVYQVTSSGVHGPAGIWRLDDSKKKIALAAANDRFILLACGSELILLRAADQGQLHQVASQTLEHEIACLDIARLYDDNGIPCFAAAVGLWNSYSVLTLQIPDLIVMDSVKVETTFLLRSVLLVDFAEQNMSSAPYLLVGLGDGSVVSYHCNAATDRQVNLDSGSKKTVVLGSRPITMSRIRTGGNAEAGIPAAKAVFIISDRSTIVSLDNGKLAYASSNLQDIIAVSAFHNPAYENALVLASPDALRIGRVDELQKLQVKTLRLGEEAPRRIVHSAKLRAYGVVFLKESVDRKTGEVTRSSSFKVLDDTSFEVLADFPMDKYEEGRSIACVDPSGSEDDPYDVFIVGTGVIRPDEDEAQRGRVMVFAGFSNGQYKEIAEGETRGAVHAIAQLPDGKFAVTSNSEIIVFDRLREDDDGRLQYLCNWGATFIAYKLTSKGDLLCAVDPLRSASLVRFDSENNKLIDIAKEFSAYGLQAAAFLEGGDYNEPGQETILAADLDFNLFTAKRTKVGASGTSSMASRSVPQQPVEKLQTQAMIHTGEMINTFCKGSLVPSFVHGTGMSTGQLIFGTSVGSIGMVTTLSTEQSKLLSQVERNMRRVITNVGNLRQADYRAFKTEYRTDPAAGFIDGSFVEELTNLSKEEIEMVVQGGSEHETITDASTEEVIRLVEELQRMH